MHYVFEILVCFSKILKWERLYNNILLYEENTMSQKMHIHWDSEGDHLEVRFGDLKPSYYEEVGDDVFERRDEETNRVIGYAFFNV